MKHLKSILNRYTCTQSQTSKKVIQLAWPVIIANFSLPLLGIVDTSVVGHLDSEVYLAGIALGASLMAFVFWGFNFLSMGISGSVSQALGREDQLEIRSLLYRYLIIALVLALLLMVSSPWLIDLGLTLMNATEAVSLEAATYLQIRAFGVPAILLNLVMIGWFTGMQNTRVALYTQFVAQLLNIALDLWFVLGLGWRTEGIAVGTVCAEYLATILLVVVLVRQPFSWGLAIPLKKLLSRAHLRSIFSVSQALFIRTFALLFSFAYFNHLGAQIGDRFLAANAILLSLLTLISHLLDGLAAAAEALTGRAIGAQDRQELDEVLAVTGLLSVSFAIFLTIVLAISGDWLLLLMTNQPEVLALASDHLIWLILMPLWATVSYWLDGVFIGARLSRQMRNSVLLALLLLYLPISTYLSPLTNDQLWLCFSVFMIGRSLLMLFFLTLFYRRLNF